MCMREIMKYFSDLEVVTVGWILVDTFSAYESLWKLLIPGSTTRISYHVWNNYFTASNISLVSFSLLVTKYFMLNNTHLFLPLCLSPSSANLLMSMKKWWVFGLVAAPRLIGSGALLQTSESLRMDMLDTLYCFIFPST